MQEFDLEDYVRKLRASDTNSFKAIVKHFHSGIFNFLIFKTNDRVTAEDLLQETFLKLWETRHRLNETQSVKSYLFTIANNLALNHIRHQKMVMSFMEKAAIENSTAETPYEQLTRKELEECIEQAINQMSDKVRMVFLMCKAEGLSYKEIAERLDLSVATVESHMVKSLRMIREALDKHNR